MSSEEARAIADARLTETFDSRGYADPRPALRDRMRSMRAADPTSFDAAARRYEESVVRAIGAGADPLEAWIEYGRFLGELGSGGGRVLCVDETGRASPRTDEIAGRDLILFVPEDARATVLPLACPAAPSPAQRAAYDLLVLRRLTL